MSGRNGILGVFAVASLGLVLLAVQSLVHSRRQHEIEGAITAQNLCRVLASELTGSIHRIDLAVLSIRDAVDLREGDGLPEAGEIERRIAVQLQRVPMLSGMRLANEAGVIVLGNDVPAGSKLSIADRDYFMRLKADPRAGLAISRPVVGIIVGKPVVMFARRVERRDGSFAGIVYGMAEIERLQRLFDALSLGPHGVIVLRDQEQAIIVQSGGAQGARGGDVALVPEYLGLVRDGQTSGTLSCVNATDGRERLYSFVKMEPFGHYLCVGLDHDDVFGTWWREVWVTLGFCSLVLAFLASAVLLIRRAWDRQQRAEAEQERMIAELKEALAEVKVLSGLLPICCSCKSIRDDHGYWNKIESYLSTHSDARFSHGYCPSCMKKLFPDIEVPSE